MGLRHRRAERKENIEVELVKFTDYTTPNNALAEGEIDLSSFQTEIFMDNYNRDHGTELTTIGYTVMAPLGLYSEKITSINELKDGDTIVIPNDVSNEGRALILLADSWPDQAWILRPVWSRQPKMSSKTD